MKKVLVAAVAASALVLAGAPAAQAQGLGPCTFAYVDDVSNTSSGPLVTYTPPATVTVHGDSVLSVANYLVGATQDYVRCLMQRG
ncbi:MAG: hypothetical protein M3134_08655 [Actinomycetota bacterium]|nr:hypothetical protein [Actinomycetota bacterium]